MGWWLLQISIALAIGFANIYWQWTPNGYAIGVLILFVTMTVTYGLSWCIDLWRRKRRRALPVHKRRDDGSRSGV